MINLYNQVPTIYSEASRDFQYLSWLINIVLNSVKHNVDDMYNLPKPSVDSKLSELLAFTLGFKVRRNYNTEQLLALVNIIPSLLKYKGTAYAVSLAGNALIKASGALGDCIIALEEEDDIKKLKEKGILKVVLPKDLVDTTLFIDLLPYILPAGISCQIVRSTVKGDKMETIIGYQSVPIASWQQDATVSKGVSGLYNTTITATDARKPNFTNYDDSKLLNAGLMHNTVVPALLDPISDYYEEESEK